MNVWQRDWLLVALLSLVKSITGLQRVQVYIAHRWSIIFIIIHS